MKLSQYELEGMFDAGLRIGRIIHVQGSLIDEDSPSDEMREFIEDEIGEPHITTMIGDAYPGFSDAMARIKKTYESDRKEFGRKDAEEGFMSSAAEWMSQAPFSLLVRIDSQFMECSRANPGGKCLGSWRAGWGITHVHWYAVNDISEAVAKAIERKNAERVASWQKAIDEGRVSV